MPGSTLQNNYLPSAPIDPSVVRLREKCYVTPRTYLQNSSFLSEDDLREKPLLVLANKQDCDNVMSAEFITEQLELHKRRDREWRKLQCQNITIKWYTIAITSHL